MEPGLILAGKSVRRIEGRGYANGFNGARTNIGREGWQTYHAGCVVSRRRFNGARPNIGREG